MNRDIQLYIDGKLVEWNGTPNIQFTYQTTDYTNPTVVKNNFSKTVQIDGTPENNRIFNEIWHLDRVMDAEYSLFNPSQKVPFELYRNDEIVEKGYAKLDSINKEGYKVGYNITLYGGLGSFFYSLDYDINSDKEKSLSDLDFMGSDSPDDEFTFEINKNRVYDAWARLGQTGNTGSWKKWNYINFAPCYNGLPENFDTSKVLFNTHGLGGMYCRWTNDDGVHYSTLPHSISSNGTAFTPYNGYLYGDLNKDLTEWEVRDLRSYLQRPVLSVKGMIDAICRPQNNGGYTVDLDKEFFSSNNPYYDKAWITLPLLDAAIETEGESLEFLWSGDTRDYTYPRGRIHSYKIVPITSLAAVPNTLEFNVEVHATFTGCTANTLYNSIRNSNAANLYCGTLIQIYINKDLNLNIHPEATGAYPNPVCGSNRFILTSKLPDGTYWHGMANHTPVPYKNVPTEWVFGCWKRVSGDDYVWTKEDGSTNIKINIPTENINLIPMICYYSQSVSNYSNHNNIYQYTGMAYSSQSGTTLSDALSKGYSYLFTDHVEDNGSFKVMKGGDVTRSNTTITKKMLFGGLDVTPCDWLLGYCKLFGLHLFKDKNDDIIYIRMRKNFYEDEVVDINDIVDRGQDIKITPLTFDSKWYTFNYAEAESKFMDTYKKNFNQDFGKQLVDTRYNFDSESVDLLEGTVYRNGLTCLEKSNYYNNKYDVNDTQIPTVLYDWVKFKYYALEDTYETNMALPQGCRLEYINPYVGEEFYDVVPKLQFHDVDKKGTDGEGVLVFFNGRKSTGNVKYWITDDVDEMFRESENPCWLATMDEWTSGWTERIAIGIESLPEFNRYVVHASNVPINRGGLYQNITAAWDFGRTKELFVPYYRYDVDKTPTIYENFWQKYINDLYSVDTRKVDAYMDLKTNSVYDALRRFYWFDNSIWVMNKVENYDICLERATKCQFTKVNDLNSYLHDVTFDDYFFRFYRIGAGNIPYSGSTSDLTVNFMLDSSDDWLVMTSDYITASVVGSQTINALSGTAGTNISVQGLFTPNPTSSPRSVTFYGVNLETNMMIPIIVTQDCWQNSTYLFLSTSEYPIPMITTNMTFMVLVYSSDPWVATCSESWVNVITPSGAAGDEVQFYFRCDNNATSVDRSAIVRFSNGTENAEFRIIQRGRANASIEQSGNTSIIRSSGETLDYVAVCDTDWELVPVGSSSAYTSCSDYNTPKSATTGYTTQIVVAQNNSPVSRNIMFQMEYNNNQNIQRPVIIPLPLVQQGSGHTVVYYDYQATGDTFNLHASLPWSAYTYNPWITVNTTSGTSADTSLTYSIVENEGSYRIGYVTVRYTDEYGYPCSEVLEIHQSAKIQPLIISPSAITAPYSGGNYLVSVTASTTYTATTNNDWIVLDNDRVVGITTFEITENQADVARIGRITFTDGTNTADCVINQLSQVGNGSYIMLLPSGSTFANSGGSGTVTVYCEEDWVLNTNDSWISLNANSGSGNTIVPYTVSANSSDERDGLIVAQVSGYPQYSASTVVMQGANRYLTADSPMSFYLYTASTKPLAVSSNVDWVATTEDSWISLSPSSGVGDGTIYVTVESGTTVRSGSIVLTNSQYGLTFVVEVWQTDNNVITYKKVSGTTDQPLEIRYTNRFYDASGNTLNIVAHNYSNHIGQIILDGDLYRIGNANNSNYSTAPWVGIESCEEFVLPSSLRVLGNMVFASNSFSSLKTVNLDNIKTFGYASCQYLRSQSLVLSNATTLYDGVFSFCTNLQTVYCYATTAPTISSNAFYNAASNVVVHYPSGSNYSSWVSVCPNTWTFVGDL